MNTGHGAWGTGHGNSRSRPDSGARAQFHKSAPELERPQISRAPCPVPRAPLLHHCTSNRKAALGGRVSGAMAPSGITLSGTATPLPRRSTSVY